MIGSLPNKSSSGHDGVSNIFLKALNESISYPLSIIFNQSLNQGVFPDLMKCTKVIPLYKGQQQDLVIHYHPISLLMTISKLLEKILYSRMYKLLETNEILYESQFGFRSRHSCEHAIAELSGRLLQAKEQGQYSAAVFLDLSKAFDTLNHKVLLHKLERYRIRDTSHKWFESYLQNRNLVAKITTSLNNVTYSNLYDIMYGTTQGSCLGPLLFLIFCNDMHLLPLYGQIILFTDDTNLLCSHRDKKFLEFMLKHDMELLTFWFRASQLSLNMGKTVLMTFWDTPNMNVLVDNTAIPHVEQTKFLGVILDRQLTWRSNHTNTLYNKIIANKLLLLKSKKFISNKG